MKTIKRTLAVLLTLLMLMSAVPLTMMHAGAADEWVASGGQQTLDCVESWPNKTSATAGFCTNNQYYKTYNKKIPSNTSTTKYEVIDKKTIGYLYWHWCYSHSVGKPVDCVFRDSKDGTVPKYDANGNPTGTNYVTSNFHAIFRDENAPLTYYPKKLAYKYDNAKSCPYNFWWAGKIYGKEGQLPVVRVTYQRYEKANPSATHTVTYNYSYNGGTSATRTSASVVEGAAIDLTPTATKSGWSFVGWNTNPTAATALSSLQMGTSDVTLYAIFKEESANIYNLGEETYSFENYVDDDSPYGHCFGMAVTSSGYYIGTLNISIIGGNESTPLYSFPDSPTVRAPICYYLPIQGPGAEYQSIVAGGSQELQGTINPRSDWNSCVNYVKGHQFDNNGTLNVGMWFADGGGHAVNFLYYKEVSGQERIYVYDNNHPDSECYYYLGTDGYIYEAPDDFGAIDGFDLMDVNSYFALAPQFKRSRYIYAEKDKILVDGAKMYNMKCSPQKGLYVMYEIPENTTEVKIKPLSSKASFRYLDEQYSFDDINDKTYGVLKLATKDGATGEDVTFKIVDSNDSNICKWCGGQHDSGFFQKIIAFFHKILASLFGAKY